MPFQESFVRHRRNFRGPAASAGSRDTLFGAVPERSFSQAWIEGTSRNPLGIPPSGFMEKRDSLTCSGVLWQKEGKPRPESFLIDLDWEIVRITQEREALVCEFIRPDRLRLDALGPEFVGHVLDILDLEGDVAQSASFRR